MTAPSVPAGDVAKLVEELRAGLDGVTPGPWQSEQPSWDDETDDADECPRYVASVVATVDDVSAVARLRCDQRADAAHIARCSPDNIAKLLVENARLSRDLVDARAALADPVVVHRNMLAGIIAKPSVANIAHLYPEVQQMRQALIATLKHFRRPTSAEHETRDRVMAALSHFDAPPLTPYFEPRSVLSTQPKETPDVA